MTTDFRPLEDLLPQLAFDDPIAGGALTIFHQGACVVDAAFGKATADSFWTPHTLSLNFSVGKGVLATLVAVLVSRGVLDYAAPIANYWPEFAQNNKASICLLDVLSHRAGLFNIASIVAHNDEAADWHAMLDKVAAMSPDIPQDQNRHDYASAYSALVSGWIIGGVIEQATQQPLQQVLDEALAIPLGVQGELFFGLPIALHEQLARPVRLFHGMDTPFKKKPVLKPDSSATVEFLANLPISHLWQKRIVGQLATSAINRCYFDPSQMNLSNYKNALLADGKSALNYYAPQLLSASIPAANGISTSHALATVYAMHANDGHWNGKTLIDAGTLHTLRQVYSDGFDAVMPANMRWRAGFHRLFSVQNAPEAYGHMGYNGCVAFCDPSRKLAFAFVHNFDTTMLGDVRQFVLSEMALWLAK